MKLTVGATLQDGKYAIQEVVTQNDWSISCKATHTYLDQTVLLQTFSETAQQQPDFAQLAQQFVQRVRHLAKHPGTNNLHVLDCFKEENLPFVVLELAPDRQPLPLDEWFACLPHPDSSATHLPADPPNPSALLEVTPAPVIADAAATVNLANHLMPTKPVPSAQPEAETVLPALSEFADRPSKTATARKLPPVKPSKPKAQLPIALMVMALVGGSVGAGMGVAMRLSTAANPQGGKPHLSFFNREQSFPPNQDWPVQEEAIYTPQPAIEQPLYRTPAEPYTPSVMPPSLPAETTALPDPIYTPAAIPDPEPIESPAELPPLKPKARVSQDPVPPAAAPPVTEAPSAIDEPPPLPDPIAPEPPAVTPQPVLPPINAAPVPPITKPLPNNSNRTTL